MKVYTRRTATSSLLTNDPKDKHMGHNNPKYTYNLLLRIITVSPETMKIVRSLPKLKLE